MKKTTFNFSTLMVIAFATSSFYVTVEKQTNDLTERNLKGKVKSIEQYHFYSDNSSYKEKVSNFNIDGMLTLEIDYNNDGSLSSKAEYQYDFATAKLTKSIFKNEDGNIESYITYSYNSKGNLIKAARFKPNSEEFSKFEYQYNDMELLLYEFVYLANNDTIGCSKYFYNKSGQKVKKLYYSDNWGKEKFNSKTPVDSTNYYYDQSKNLILEESFHYNGSMTNRKQYDNGRKISEESFNSKYQTKYDYTYNSNDDVIEEKLFSTESNPNTTVMEHTKYDYDSNGNWTNKYGSQDNYGIVVHGKKRVFTYY